MASPFKNVAYDAHMTSMQEFESAATAAKAAGITHMNISRPVHRTRFVDRDDERNPWADWGVMYASLFKHYTGPELEGVYAPECVKQEVENLRRKHEICARLGLRSVYHCNEPMYLPNKFFLKYPAWRGARGDNCLRTRDWLCSPCVDHPEVLDLYRRIVRDVVKIAPSIDVFSFATNDAGASMCWAEGSHYPSGGSTACEKRNMGDRVTGFLKAVRQGAVEGGTDAWAYANVGGTYSEGEKALILARLEPGIGVSGAYDPSKPKQCFLGGASGWSPWSTHVMKMPFPFAFLGGLEGARKAGLDMVKIGWYLGHSDAEATCAAYRVFCELEPGSMDTLRGKMDAVKKVAAALFAPEVAEEVMEAWYEIHLAREMNVGTHPVGIGTIANRWLVRPILGTQHLLKAEELEYCMRWIYQLDPEGWREYLRTHRRRMAESYQHAQQISNTTGAVTGKLRRAASILRKAMGRVGDARVQQRLELDALRCDAWRCLLANASNTVQLGVLALEREKHADRYTDQTDPVQPSPWEGSAPLQAIYKLQRAELDNTYELIDILQKAPEPLVLSEQDAGNESYWRYGPNLIEQLKIKAELMTKHWRDADGLYFQPMSGT